VIEKSRPDKAGAQMTEASRGPGLTTFAVLFAILALSNFLSRFTSIRTLASYFSG
jgi:hypothetical protein